jgi:hypothetical protein
LDAGSSTVREFGVLGKFASSRLRAMDDELLQLELRVVEVSPAQPVHDQPQVSGPPQQTSPGYPHGCSHVWLATLQPGLSLQWATPNAPDASLYGPQRASPLSRNRRRG